MKSSSFFSGMLIGAVAAIWASRRGYGVMSTLNGVGSALNMSGLSMGRNHRNDADMSKTSQQGPTTAASSKVNGAGNAQVYPSSVSQTDSNYSKEYRLKQITDFIKSNADVRREVDAILKETHSAIPGL